MPWATWDYHAGPAGSVSDLADFCDQTRIVAEFATGKRGSNPVLDHQHGEYSSPRKYLRASNFILETFVRYTDSTGAVTHVDGAAGHIMENLGELKRIFNGLQGQLVRLRRTAPHQGTVYRDIEVLGDPSPSQARHIFTWPMKSPSPFWVGAADTGNTPPTLTVAGDAPIDDAVISFTGTCDNPRLTLTSTGDYIEIVGTLPAGGVIVDIGAETALRISGGADWSNNLRVRSPWWMQLDPGANAVTLTESSGTAVASVDWVTKWL